MTEIDFKKKIYKLTVFFFCLFYTDVPNFSDAHVPVVAREILQRMIRQFAAEYTSKTSPPQDSLSDQSPPNASSLSGAAPPSSSATTAPWPARSHNPVLSKLLMAVQDAPLDLTVKKPSALPGDQGADAFMCGRSCLRWPSPNRAPKPTAFLVLCQQMVFWTCQ